MDPFVHSELSVALWEALVAVLAPDFEIPIFGSRRAWRSKFSKILVLKPMMKLSHFGSKRAQNRTRNFFEPVLHETNFISPSDHQKCVFECPAFFSSPILRPPGTPFWPTVVVQGSISR